MPRRLNATQGPTVSVLTTSYNHARWLPDTLKSVRVQDYPLVEHLVVDDGSTDASVELLAAWPEGRLRWKSGPNQGQAKALNEALRMSSGEIIGWLSSDDAYYDRGVVRAVVEAFEKHPDADLIYGHAVLINADGLQLHAEWVPPVGILGWQSPLRIIQPAVFLRRSALGDKMVDESFDIAMDTELWLRLWGKHAFLRLDRILAAERHHPARKSYTMASVSAEEGRRLGLRRARGGGWAQLRHKTWSVAYRLVGLTILASVKYRPSGFDGRLDSRLAMSLRQIAIPRSWMPTGEDAKA